MQGRKELTEAVRRFDLYNSRDFAHARTAFSFHNAASTRAFTSERGFSVTCAPTVPVVRLAYTYSVP